MNSIAIAIAFQYPERPASATRRILRSHLTGAASASKFSSGASSRSSSSRSNNNPNQLWNRSSESLKNEYYLLRHGQSKANVAQVIASSPTVSIKEYGLSELGKTQAVRAGETVLAAFEESTRARSILLLTSDLLRAKETAEIVQQVAQNAGISIYKDSSLPNIQNGLAIETRLRERWFGEWDGTSDKNYPKVWKDDAIDPDHTKHGVESVNQVVHRTTQCIVEWDDIVSDCFVVCVAHGDVLQILQSAFAKMNAKDHRSLEHLETATLRRIHLADS